MSTRCFHFQFLTISFYVFSLSLNLSIHCFIGFLYFFYHPMRSSLCVKPVPPSYDSCIVYNRVIERIVLQMQSHAAFHCSWANLQSSPFCFRQQPRVSLYTVAKSKSSHFQSCQLSLYPLKC